MLAEYSLKMVKHDDTSRKLAFGVALYRNNSSEHRQGITHAFVMNHFEIEQWLRENVGSGKTEWRNYLRFVIYAYDNENSWHIYFKDECCRDLFVLTWC